MIAFLDGSAGVRVRAILASGLVFGLGAVGTMAAWSTSSTTTSGTFVTGSVDITVNGQEGVTTPASIALPVGGILPGRSTAALVTVRNAGNISFTYTPTQATTGSLGTNITTTARVGTGVAVSDGATGLTCTGGTTPVLSTARPLAAGASESVCVQFALSLATPNTLQGASNTVVFTFPASGVGSA